MRKFIFSIFITSISACTPKVPSLKIEKAYKEWGEIQQPKSPDTVKISRGNSLAILRYNSENKLMSLKTLIDEHNYGHMFQFDTEGKLYVYQFYVNDSEFSYETYRKFMEDSLIERGSPFVDFMRNKGKEDKISLLFSNFPRRIVNVQLSTDGHTYNDIQLYKSKFIPLLLESDILMPKGSRIFLIIKAEGLQTPLLGLADQKLFYDTTVLVQE